MMCRQHTRLDPLAYATSDAKGLVWAHWHMQLLVPMALHKPIGICSFWCRWLCVGPFVTVVDTDSLSWLSHSWAPNTTAQLMSAWGTMYTLVAWVELLCPTALRVVMIWKGRVVIKELSDWTRDSTCLLLASCVAYLYYRIQGLPD